MNFIKDYYFKIPELLRFVLVSLMNTLLGFLIIFIIYPLYDIANYTFLLLVAYFIIISLSFLTNKFLVFKGTGTLLYQYLKTFLVYLINIFLNTIVVILLTKYGNVSYKNAQVTGAIIIFIITYLLLKNFAFKDLHFKLLKKTMNK